MKMPDGGIFAELLNEQQSESNSRRGRNGTSKILALTNFSSNLEISTAFAKSCTVSFILHLFQCEVVSVFISSCFGIGLGFANKGLGVLDFTIHHPF